MIPEHTSQPSAKHQDETFADPQMMVSAL